MRRYTAIKSNVYAPTSTNIIQQNMLHCHMTCHYRMMYNAKSKVDSSPPRQYKGRGFPLTDCPRKKLNKYPVRSNRKRVTCQPEMELHNQLLIDRILYDTKLPPTAYIHECVTQRQYMNESSSKLQSVDVYKVDSKDLCQCQNVDCVPSLNISSKKVKQLSQCRDYLNKPWTKRPSCNNKWNTSHLKHLENSHDVVRNSIPRQISKPRLFHSAQCRRTLFPGEITHASSGSEGNAGDDEDGVPTSSYDDSNPSDTEKHKLSCQKVSTPDSGPLFKKATTKRQGKACPCIPVVERAKKVPASEISSRDSAYGGEGMSSTEKERTSPDHVNDDGIFQCVGGNFSNVSKADSMNLLPQEESQFCFKSELYMKFLQDVTDDILVQGVYTNQGLERLFQEHINNNAYSLDKNHLRVMITKLGEDLGMPVIQFGEDKLFEERNDKQLKSDVKEEENTECIMESENQMPVVNSLQGNQLIPKDERSESQVDGGHWIKKQFSSEEIKSSPSVVIIEKNFSMSKKDILDNLVYLDFDESMAEEIYHILAGKGCTYPDFTLKELQEIVQQ